ncbi:MAG: ribonuclease HI [Lachnospiraceae bacterium]|nr:ribonuclease HI [Lachnospiraceae bacterium]
MTDMGKKLMNLLREIYDDHDFVCGTMSNCGGEEAWGKMYQFITYANAHNESISSDDVLALSLILGKEMDIRNKIVCSA